MSTFILARAHDKTECRIVDAHIGHDALEQPPPSLAERNHASGRRRVAIR